MKFVGRIYRGLGIALVSSLFLTYPRTETDTCRIPENLCPVSLLLLAEA